MTIRPTNADLNGWFVLTLHNGGATLKIVEAIRCNATGEIRERESVVQWNNGEDGSSTFWWSDGNAACDCNRAEFFADMGGEPDPNVECSHGLFAVRLKNWKTGKVFYDEFEDCNT